MAFELADDVRAELERLSRITKRDPNDLLRELLEIPRKKRLELGGKPAAVIPAQVFYQAPKGDRPRHGRIVMKRSAR